MSQWQVAGNAPENYEGYLVPSIFGPWAIDLVSLAAPQFPSPEEFVRRYVTATPLAGSFAQTYKDARNALLDEMRRGLQEYENDEGVAFSIETHLVSART